MNAHHKKIYLNIINAYRGSALLWAIGGSTFLVVISYIGWQMLSSHQMSRDQEIQMLQAKNVLNSVVEFGKYLLSYERVIFLHQPLKVTPERRTALLKLQKQGFGSLDADDVMIINACGGYDVVAQAVGDLKVNGELVFCPFYFRHSSMDNPMLDQLLFNYWLHEGTTQIYKKGAAGGIESVKGIPKLPILKNKGAGFYELELDLTSSIKKEHPDRLWWHLDQNFIQSIRQKNPKLKLIFTFYSASGGFKGISNERIVNIKGFLSYEVGFRKFVLSETKRLIMYLPTVKDFSIFIPFPEDQDGKKTNSFQKAFNIPSGGKSKIYGRVFFNGNIDVTNFDDLPEFYGSVILSGRVTALNGISFDQRLEKIKQKFKGGIIENFPAERFLFDGSCSADPTVNHSEMFCKHPMNAAKDFLIEDYIINLNHLCSQYPVVINNGVFAYHKPPKLSAPVEKLSCTNFTSNNIFVSGGLNKVKAEGTHAFILSPIKKFESLSEGLQIYGTILGGHLSLKDGMSFYSISQLKEGMVGIPDSTTLGEITKQAQMINSGIGVPLINMPIIKDVSIGEE